MTHPVWVELTGILLAFTHHGPKGAHFMLILAFIPDTIIFRALHNFIDHVLFPKFHELVGLFKVIAINNLKHTKLFISEWIWIMM